MAGRFKAAQHRLKLSYWVGICVLSLSTSLVRSHAATIVHTNDVFGDIEPCGCRTHPQGGMSRKANLMHKLDDPFVVQVDAGDLLFATPTVSNLLKDQAKLQASYLLKAMDLAHHDVVVPGEKDFALGKKVFDELRKTSKIHFLAANLKLKSGQKYLESHTIIKGKSKDGKNISIGIFGLVGADLKWPKEFKITSAIEAAKREIKELKKSCDYIVAVTHQGLDADKALAEKTVGIDYIFGGHTQSFLQIPVQVKATVIFQSSFRNQYVGVLSLKKPFNSENYNLVGLDEGYESVEGRPTEMDKLVSSFKKDIGDLNTKHDAQIVEMTAHQSGGSGSSDHFQTFPRCAECHYKQFDFWRKTAHARALNILVEKNQAKNKECLQCHTLGLGHPQGFSSVNQIAEVRQPVPQPSSDPQDSSSSPKSTKTQYLDPEELNYFMKNVHQLKTFKEPVNVLHSGPSYGTLPQALNVVHKAWAPVQCENCHEPGGSHPFSGNYSKKVEKTKCFTCHTAERAPEWYDSKGQPKLDLIEEKRKSITCPAGDITELE